MKKIGLNGFGRIGKLIFRLSLEREDLEIVAINDLSEIDYMIYMLKHDSVHGTLKMDIDRDDNHIIINGKHIRITNHKDPNEIDWKSVNADTVIDATGIFYTQEMAQAYINHGAKRVIMTGPPKDDTPMFVLGVNSHTLTKEHTIISNASCTTNCLAPLIKIMHDTFGVEEALMTTVHASTATQKVVDGPSSKDWRAGRAAIGNIIPATTGAAKAVAMVVPELKGKITGMAFRVPTLDVSVVDLTVRLTKSTDYDTICKTIKERSESDYKGIVHYVDEEVVSSDFIGNRNTCIFDAKAGIILNPNFVKLIAWYDNEIGYSSKVLDMISIWPQ